MKEAILIVIILTLGSPSFSQNDSINILLENVNDLELDHWELVEYAQENLSEDNLLAKFFYYWIGKNISYDQELFLQLETGNLTNKDFWESQEYYQVYNNRKGICAGYAGLYQWFMMQVNIRCEIVSGHIRDERNHYVELDSDDDFYHAWNVIKLDDRWMIVDSTWGTSDDTEVSDFYFDINPEFAIITHYPEDSKWQLLADPISLDEFNKSKYINPIWFFLGFSDIPRLMEDSDYYYFVYRINNNKEYSVELLVSSDNSLFQPIEDIERIDLDGYTNLRFGKSNIPLKAFYKVHIIHQHAMEGYSSTSKYHDVINFKTL